MIENVIEGVLITFIYTSIIWVIVLVNINSKWDKWAIKVGKARYNQMSGILEYDEE